MVKCQVTSWQIIEISCECRSGGRSRRKYLTTLYKAADVIGGLFTTADNIGGYTGGWSGGQGKYSIPAHSSCGKPASCDEHYACRCRFGNGCPFDCKISGCPAIRYPLCGNRQVTLEPNACGRGFIGFTGRICGSFRIFPGLRGRFAGAPAPAWGLRLIEEKCSPHAFGRWCCPGGRLEALR